MQLTEVQESQIEALKRVPEQILKVEQERVAVCNRCQGRIPLNQECLFFLRTTDLQVSIEKQKKCPVCGACGPIRVVPFKESLKYFPTAEGDTIEYGAIPHQMYQITRYTVGYRKIGVWPFSKMEPIIVEEPTLVRRGNDD